ncbi:MAG TPA: hypothetical protein VNB24_01955 [Acidimicrobiales bacterium]|nr:hypothetical protein [Acidimicrobiales bacterium]
MLDEEEGARRLELAGAAMAVFDADTAAEHLSVAIRAFTSANRPREAALACARLGYVCGDYLGNPIAARAWYLRATRLIENEPECLEQGWVALASLGCDVGDPDALFANAELALDRARRFGDVNLETKALADGGLALVQAGRIDEGMRRLDEAMALASGPADDDEAAGMSVCSFLTACYFACDFDRAAAWVDALRKRGLIGVAPGVQMFVANHCDAVQATLLVELGQWTEAERVLTRALEDFERTMGGPSWHPAIALAELRIRQGRLTDAEQLLIGKDGRFQALLPAARLHLARGDLELARATATRGLRAIGDDRLRAAELLAILVDVELRADDAEAAAQRVAELVDRAKGVDVPALAVRVASAQGRARAACGDHAAAIETIEDALDRLPQARVPFLRATLLIDLVRLHDHVGDAAAAKVEAARVAAALDGLDVVVPADDLALLERVASGCPAGTDATRARSASERTTAQLTAQAKGWTVTCGGERIQLSASKGLSYLSELIRNPGSERHALDLVDRVEGVSVGGPDRRALGDAGPLLDAAARTAYRRRIEALRSEIEDAFALGADTRAEELQAEVDRLVAELARAFGLGGQERRASSAAERARLNVTRALRTAVARVSEALPEAGSALDRSLRTGIYCAYEPKPDSPVHWIVQS